MDKRKIGFQRIEIRNLYGPSEDTTYSTCYRFKNDIHSVVPIGHPINGTKLVLFDQDGNETPVGIPGEICLSGPCIAKGYLNQPEKTRDVFIQSDYSNSLKLYKTGDIGRRLADGQI